MSPVVLKGLEAITSRTNLTTGLTHSNDINAAREMFVLLHGAGEILPTNEIESYAVKHGWNPDDAKELARLGAQVGMGKKPRIKAGRWWTGGIIERFRSEADGTDA